MIMEKKITEERYVVVDYDDTTDEHVQPKIACTTNDLPIAEECFQKSAERKILSAILYDHKTNDVLKIAIQGPPIYLVRAIEFSRGIKYIGEVIVNTMEKTAAGLAIGKIVAAIAGSPIPGVGGVVVAHFLAPYYAFKGDHVGVVEAGAGLWGGLSGSVIGFLSGGPPGAVIGGIIGGFVVGKGAGLIVKASVPPENKKKCENCKGAGLVADYRKCPDCEGYGYT